MQTTQDLVNKIEKNKAQSIEINEQIAWSDNESIPKSGWINYATPINIGNNQVALIHSVHHGQTNIGIFDLSTVTMGTIHTLQFTNPTTIKSAALLKDPNYIALGAKYGQLLILDLNKMQITATHQIGVKDSLDTHSLTVRQHNGILYGITDSSYSPGRVFFSAPAVPTLTPKIIKVDNVTATDVALDAGGYAYFPYGHYANLTADWHYQDNPTLHDLGSALHLGISIRLIQQETGDSYLAITRMQDHETSGICIFKNQYNSKGIFASYMYASLTLVKEQIWEMEVLSKQDAMLLIRTNISTYIYDLHQSKIIGKFSAKTTNLRIVSDGILFSTYPETSIVTTHKLNELNALSQVFDALQNNQSVKQLTITRTEMDAASLRSLYQLKIKRPELKLVLTPGLETTLNSIKEQEAEKVSLRTTISTTLTAHTQALATKNQELMSKNEVYLSLKKKFDSFCKEKDEIQAAHAQQIKELTATLSSQAAEHQQHMQAQKEVISKLTGDLSDNQSIIDSLQEELSNITQAYSESVTLLTKPVSPKSLMEQIEESKESLSPELLAVLVNEETNLNNISLIRWSEQKEVQRYQHTLRQKGALLSVSDILEEIKKIEPPYEQQKIDRLFHAAEQLTLKYKDGVLPQQVVLSLESLIVPEIKKALAEGNPLWLDTLNRVTIKSVKMGLKKAYFSNVPREENPSLDSLFQEVVTELASINEYSAYLQDKEELLLKIRSGNVEDPIFDQLVETIKESISFNKIELTLAQQDQAFQSLLRSQKPDMVQLIHNHIIQYWEKVKQTLNPHLIEITSIKAENAALKQQLRNFSPQLSPTRSGAALFAHNPAAENGVVNAVANGLNNSQ